MAQTPRRKKLSFDARIHLVQLDGDLRKVLAAVKDVRAHRRMNAPEDPETQDAWDRLRVAVLEAERTLQKPVDNRRR